MSSFDYDVGWDTQWDDMKKFGPMSRHVRRIVLKLIRPLEFRTVLDVGCGQGSLLRELIREFPAIEPYGCDVSATAVELSRRKVPEGEFQVLDLVNEALPRTFDLLVCSEVVEHIEDDVAALRNLRRMCGRYLLITTVQGRMRSFEPEAVGHVRNYGRRELVDKLGLAGFEVVQRVDWGFPFYSPLYHNVLELTGSRGTTGQFGQGRRLLATALYYIFHLNLPVWGDEIFVLARPVAAAGDTV
jgi:SAM-dependent methyltransferase